MDAPDTTGPWRSVLTGSLAGLLGAVLLWHLGQERAALIAVLFSALGGVLGVLVSFPPRRWGKVGGYTLTAAAIVVWGMGLIAVGGLGLIGIRENGWVMDVLLVIGGVAVSLFGCFGLSRELGWSRDE